MPARPLWYSKINDIVREREALPRPFVDRPTVEFLLGVGRRRAQQILAPCITDHVGANGLADREAFSEPRQALGKLLALAMAIGNDFALFERATTLDMSNGPSYSPL